MLVKKYTKADLNKFFKPSEVAFLGNLSYWLSRKNNYGIEKFEKRWIYNTLDQWAKQTKFSKISVRRAIESLKNQNIIFTEYLSQNKRDRTLFYSINYDKLNDLLNNSKIVKADPKKQNEHMYEHMYNKDNNNKFNKSYKSQDNFSKKDSKDLSEEVSSSESLNSNPVVTEKPKNTTVQDMIKVFNTEFSDISVRLDKNLARNLVAAFKLKFEGSLEKWKKFLQSVKTSSYLMSEKFKLTLRWLLKFSTIDRLKLGELGVKIKKIFTFIPENKLEKDAEKQIAEINEPENFKEIRRKIAKKITPAKYLAWFKNIKFLQKNETIELIYPNKFVEDNIKLKFSENFSFIGV